MLKTFVYYVVLISVKCFGERFGYDENEIKNCSGSKLFLLEGQVVEWHNSVQGHVWVDGCINETLVEETLDPAMIVKYSYNELSIINTVWPTLPEAALTKTVYMNGVTPLGVWGGCSQVKKIEIAAPVNLTLIASDWLYNCSHLGELRMTGLTVIQMRAVLDTLSKVDRVAISNVPDIRNIVSKPIFPLVRGGHLWIKTLDITIFNTRDDKEEDNTNWAEISENFVWQLSLLPRLEELNIYRFDNLDWCAALHFSSITFGTLKHLWMQNTATSRLCFKNLRIIPNMVKLNVVIHQAQFGELLSGCAPQLKVGLVDSITFEREDYLMLSDCPKSMTSYVTLDLYQTTILCDCSKYLWFSRALMEGLVTVPGIACLDGSHVEDQVCDWWYCNRIRCNTACVCCDDGYNGVVADCRDVNLTDTLLSIVLQLSNLTNLLAPYTNLTMLPRNLPDSLIWIDLSGNDLLRGRLEGDIASLFQEPKRIIRLAGNSIICSCENQPAVIELQRYSHQIEDYNALSCAGEDKKLRDVVPSELCASRDNAALVVVLVSAALVVALLALVAWVAAYYRRYIQIFLFARGWCLCCIDEEELDADRRYDIFLSFCHADEGFVVEELLNTLDRDYSVCVHFRDWELGEMIPAQIWKSVEESRRTVVVLSKNFVHSLWGLLEFRSAYITGLNEGRIRVVMVVIDDVLETEKLEGELKAYVRFNTYVKWGDPWFWDKLRYALPHHPVLNEPRQGSGHQNGHGYLVSEPGGIQMIAINGADNADNEQVAIDEEVNDTNNSAVV